MRAANGYGHSGDGCVAAEAALVNAPVLAKVWFDAPNQRLAQTNPDWRQPDPDPNTTYVGIYNLSTPLELIITEEAHANASSCEAGPLPPVYCPNGTLACPPTFGNFGELFTPFTAVMGDYFLNTTFRETTPEGAQVWQWDHTQLTRMPNGTMLNVTRNYTYTVSGEALDDGTHPLLRFQWTQSIPLEPALPVHRDCFIFDYQLGYTAEAIDPARWKPPAGVTCSPLPPLSLLSSSTGNEKDRSARQRRRLGGVGRPV